MRQRTNATKEGWFPVAKQYNKEGGTVPQLAFDP